MNYKVHPVLKPLSANLQRLDMGEYFFGRDFKLELEEYNFDELWELANDERNQYEKVLNLTTIDFNIYVENFIICLDIIYKEYANNNISYESASQNFCDFFLLGFFYYLERTPKKHDFKKLLFSMKDIDLIDAHTIHEIEKAISIKSFNEIQHNKISNTNLNHVNTDKKKYQIFISSTFIDLKEERQAAVEAILKKGHIPAGMELFTAGDKSQWEIIKKWIDDSDIYLLILGGRYGSIDETTGLSYTEMEYNYAIEKKKPFFALSLSDEILDKKPIEIIKDYDLKNPKYISFKEKVKTRMCSFPSNIDQIKNEINHSLDNLISENKDKMKGWIKGN